jgi:hypothetical protein
VRRLVEEGRSGEGGAILVLAALLIIVLLGFAALTVDLGYAWAERRTSQNTADAVVMAGGLEYLASGAASNADVIAVMKDYADRNDAAFTDGDWVACVDTEGALDGYVPLDADVTDCISAKQGLTGGDEFYLRVKLPNLVLSTFFAGVLGFDTMTVSAFAEAEILYSDQSNVLPMALPHNYSTEECLGTPPSGQLKLNEGVACTGPDSGNFGLIDSPFFETHEVEGATENSCHVTPYPNFNTRAPFTLARGLDHPIQGWPASSGPVDFNDLGSKSEGVDICDADTTGGYVPYVLNTQTGNRDLVQGLIGAGTYDGEPGRLRQGTTTKLPFNNDYGLDNVGLWEYLVDPGAGSLVPDGCKPRHYDPTFGGVEGRKASDDIATCLTDTRGGGNHPEFNADLLSSPRFALVPVLSYSRGDFTGTEYRAVIELLPVYLHTSWYKCGSNAKNDPCWFQPTDWAAEVDPYSILFNPGEGSSPPLVAGKKAGDPYEEPPSIELEGISGLVLEWDWLPEGAKNELGETAPLEVTLYR